MDAATISAIIIDDEREAIHLLELYLRHFPFIQVIGKATNAKTGLKKVKTTSPDLVFLDIDMPDMNGLQVADKIFTEYSNSEIVFTTAHQHYAYDALGVKPLDFLTKPFCIDDLNLVIQKYRAKTEKKKLEHKLDNFIRAQAGSTRIKLPANNALLILELKNIVFLSTKLSSCSIYMQDGSIETVTRHLALVVEAIHSPAFFKLNRSTYINLNYLMRIDKKNQKCIVACNNKNYDFPISRAQIIQFEKMDLFKAISYI